MTFEDMWKSLEEKDTTGKYKQAREMADLNIEQLEYAYNSGYADAKSKYERPQGEWKITEAYPHKIYCGKCYKTYAQANWEVWKDGSLPSNFCPNCGSKMQKGCG